MHNVSHRKLISLPNDKRRCPPHLHYASKHSYTGVFCLQCTGFLQPCPWVPMNESSRTMALRKKTLVVVAHLSVAFKYFPSWAHDCSSRLMHIYPSWNELISGCELCFRIWNQPSGCSHCKKWLHLDKILMLPPVWNCWFTVHNLAFTNVTTIKNIFGFLT